MSHSIRHRWLCLATALICVASLAACDLDAVPRDPTIAVDAGQPDTNDQMCIPGQTRCQGTLPLVEQCADDGTQFEYKESCAAGTYCRDGACEPLATQCSESDDDSLPFATSATELTFETADDLKSTSASLTIENCGDSDIWLQRTEVRASSPSAGRSVFSVVNANDFQGLRIPPGIGETIKVTYEPAFAFSRESGNLRLQVIGEEYHEFDIPLRPRSYCVSATPRVDTGLIQGAKSGSVFLQNCGTEPVVLESVSTVPDKDDPQPQATIAMEKTSGFAPLEAGEFLELPYRISGGRLGQFNHRIIYHMADASKFTEERLSTDVSGRVASIECRSKDVPPPMVEQGQIASRGWEFVAKLDEEVGLTMGIPEPLTVDQLTPIYRFRPPDGSRSEWEPFDETFAALGKNSFQPDIPGTYRVDVNYLDNDGRPLCEWHTVRVHARPQQGLFVDLNWKTHGDLIRNDVGYGRGADLNLHVLPASSIERDLAWGDARGDCFGKGEYPTTDPSLSSDLARCELFNGRVLSASVSGAHREAIGFRIVEQERYYIAVHAWSLAGFSNAVADLRVYRDGELLDAFTLAEEADPDEATYDSLEDLLRQRLHSSNDVWILGYWDAETETLVANPTRYSGFPN